MPTRTRAQFPVLISQVLLTLMFLVSVGCTKAATEATPGKVAGTITVSEQLASKLKPTDTLYVIARAQQIGPPSAVLRIEKPRFPLKYVIGPENAMIPEAGKNDFLAGNNITIAARLSRTGNAMPSAGDLEGVYLKNPARPGDGGVDVVIDRERN